MAEDNAIRIPRKHYDFLIDCERIVREMTALGMIDHMKPKPALVPRSFVGGPLDGQRRGVYVGTETHCEAGYRYDRDKGNGNFYCIGPIHDATEDMTAHRRIDRLLELFCVVHPQMQLQRGLIVDSRRYVDGDA